MDSTRARPDARAGRGLLRRRLPPGRLGTVAAAGAATAAALTLGVGFTAGAALLLVPGLLARPLPTRRALAARTVAPAALQVPPPRTPGPSAAGATLGMRSAATLAAVKTVTFQVGAMVATFTISYLFVRDAATAATLTAFWSVAGPALYFLHEVAWAGVDAPASATRHPMVTLRFTWRGHDVAMPLRRDLAKTLTWRFGAALTDFAVIYLVVGSAIVAAKLTVTGVVVGTCLYYLHEVAWDAYTTRPRPPMLALAAA